MDGGTDRSGDIEFQDLKESREFFNEKERSLYMQKLKNELQGQSNYRSLQNEAQSKFNRIKNHTVVLGKKISGKAMLAIDDFVEQICAGGVESLRKEFEYLKTYIPSNFTYNQYTANNNKNRYKDVVCLDSTRVVMTMNVPPESDYIHANWIKLSGVDQAFIATQAPNSESDSFLTALNFFTYCQKVNYQNPLESTVSDFWRMIYQEEAKTILMLSKTVEDGKVKSAQYWPQENDGYKKYGCMFVSNKKVEHDNHFVTNTIEVVPEGSSNSVHLRLIQMIDWPDHGVPKNSASVLRMLRLIDKNAPCVVHCSAGIGRTGTVILAETCLQRLCKGYQINVPETLKELRDQRASCVQTEGQYVFAHLVILYYISSNEKLLNHSLKYRLLLGTILASGRCTEVNTKAKLPKYREVVSEFHDDFIAANLV